MVYGEDKSKNTHRVFRVNKADGTRKFVHSGSYESALHFQAGAVNNATLQDYDHVIEDHNGKDPK